MELKHASTYIKEGFVLVGDAAHAIHPLAGQGVNLGLLDAAGLVQSLVAARRDKRDFAGRQVLERFARWRRSEAEVMARGIHGIRGLFMPPALAPLRRLGLGLVSGSWLAREAFIKRAAGINRDAPRLAHGEALTDILQG